VFVLILIDLTLGGVIVTTHYTAADGGKLKVDIIVILFLSIWILTIYFIWEDSKRYKGTKYAIFWIIITVLLGPIGIPI